MISSFFSALTPWLLLTWLGQKIFKKMSGNRWALPLLCLAAAVAAIILTLPFHSLSMARWIASFSSNFSIPLMGLLVIAISEEAFSFKLFSSRDWKMAWLFGVVASLALYPSALGLGRMDSYAWGWSPYGLLVAIAIITIVLLWKKNRFGVLLLLTLAAFNFQVQESTNLWDYLIDPIYGIMSLVLMLIYFLK